jgi:hypothetical protein
MKINKSAVISMALGGLLAAVAVYQVKKRFSGIVDD